MTPIVLSSEGARPKGAVVSQFLRTVGDRTNGQDDLGTKLKGSDMRTLVTLTVLSTVLAVAGLGLSGCATSGRPLEVVVAPTEPVVKVTTGMFFNADHAMVVIPGTGVVNLMEGRYEYHSVFGLWRQCSLDEQDSLDKSSGGDRSFTFPLWNFSVREAPERDWVSISPNITMTPVHTPINVRYNEAWVGEIWLWTFPHGAAPQSENMYTLDQWELPEYGMFFVAQDLYDRVHQQANLKATGLE